jgi:hypothetical protein
VRVPGDFRVRSNASLPLFCRGGGTRVRESR